MNGFLLGDLTGVPLLPPQTNAAVAPQAGESEEGAAFQLLLDNLLFEQLAGQMFKGKGGLLAGTEMGLFTEEERQEDQNLLALLEMLQGPLLEQLRSAQPQGNLLGMEQLGQGPGQINTMAAELPLMDDLPTGNLLLAVPEEENFVATTTLGRREPNFPLSYPVDAQSLSGRPTIAVALPLGQEMMTDAGEQQPSPGALDLQPELTAVSKELPDSGFRETANQSFANLLADQHAPAAIRAELPQELNPIAKGTSGPAFSEVADQLIQSGKLKLLGAKQEMEIQLKPEYLGKLAIRLTLENGAMTARFLVESHQVSRMLDSNMQQLKQTLADQGVRFDQVQVEVGDPGHAFQERQQEWQQQRRQQTGSALPEQGEAVEAGTPVTPTRGGGGIDYRA